jgi:pSer/pThr/pTyr-binding forkhead associated (FHA) protein
VIVCTKCQKENQDHYKFCLGCGAELSREKGHKAFASDTPPHGVPAASSNRDEAKAGELEGGKKSESAPPGMSARPLAMGAAAPALEAGSAAGAAVGSAAGMSGAAQAQVEAKTSDAPKVDGKLDGAKADGLKQCPQCHHSNLLSNRFCASCGYNLGAVAAVSREPSAKRPVLLTALRADGSEAGSFPLPNDVQVVVGRDTGAVFAGDSYLSPKHACFIRGAEGLKVRDYNSLNGVYLKLQPNTPWKLEFGDVFRIGQEIIRFEGINGQQVGDVARLGSPTRGYIGRLALVIGRDTTGNAFPISEAGAHCGRERGDVLFAEDGYVSGLHCRVAPDREGSICLTDVGSSNGTFVRLRREQLLQNGAILLMGQQLFRVDI